MRSVNLLFLACFFLLVSGCVTQYVAKVVTIIGDDGNQYVGQLIYEGPYSGALTVENGPNGERFTGRFVVVDRTATQTSQGALVVPQNNQMPAIGSSTSTTSGDLNATGYWYASGNKGSKMDCILEIGRLGHGYGVCKHCNGVQYKILL